jgi:CDP-paratose synthetase
MDHIVLTGATGFLGSHLLESLVAQGYAVTILKRSNSNTWRINHLLELVESVDVDVEPIARAFRGRKVNAVIHTACNYGRSGQSEIDVIEANLTFALKVLDAAIAANTFSFLNTDTLLPKFLNSYSLSKKQFSEWLELRSNTIKIVNLKLEHMYGPNDDIRKLVPWLIDAFDKKAERVSLTEGTQLRDFIYIDDVVSAYLTILKKLDQLPAFNEFEVGTGNLCSVKEFVTLLYKTYQKTKTDANTHLGFGDLPMRLGELMSVEVDLENLVKLGWRASINLEEGIYRLLSTSTNKVAITRKSVAGAFGGD